MKATTAILKKEIKSYLYSPVAYVIGVLIIALTSVFFYLYNIEGGFGSIQPTLFNLAFFLLFTVPLIPMKTIAEERKKGTIEFLLTLPLQAKQIIIGKFLAVSLIFLMILAVTLIHTLVLILLGNPDLGAIFSIYLGVILEGLALLSLGIFISSLTDSQVIAAIASLGTGLFLLLILILSEGLPAPWNTFVGEFSFIKHLSSFFRGMIDLKDVLFFILVIIFGLSSSIYKLENEKWRI